ncbi:MAG: hypothetical protein JF606_24055 [Burkholderiales bacterium]|nr:hypothetical protein [Burkholderiales bacterium]
MYGFARGAQVFAYMERIEQVVALRTELVFNLVGDPRRTIAYAVNIGLAVEAGAVGWSAPKSVTARCRAIEQPRLLTLALCTNGRMRLVLLSVLRLHHADVAKGGVPADFFPVAVPLPAQTNLLLALLNLFVGPCLHRLLAHAAYFFNQPHLGSVG